MIRTVLLAVAALSLAACDGGKGRCEAPDMGKAPEKAANAPPAPRPGQEGYERDLARTAVDEARTCVRRYAWRLKDSEEKTETVAQAAVTACDAFVAAATQAEQGAYGARDLNAAHEANVQAMTRWATLYVVQYRAGVCD